MCEEYNFESILNVVDEMIKKHKTSNPSKLASLLNIEIKETNVRPEVFKARVYFTDKGRGIMINTNLCVKTKDILICHEIGHALLHEEYLTYHGYSRSNNIEIEANAFAIALYSRNMCLDIAQINYVELCNMTDDILKLKECC